MPIRAYQAIQHKAGPRTVVVVMLYPQIFPTTTTNLATCPAGYNDTELGRIRALWHSFDALIADRARAYGFEVADAENDFAGHLLCSGVDWAHGFEPGDMSTSYHPNGGGHDQMARHIESILSRPDVLARLQAP